jgi:ABC-type polysaccharide/polyol phosphate export permease
MDEAAFREKLKSDGIEDRMTAAIYLKADFDQKMLAGNSAEAFEIDILSDDGRCEMFETEAGSIAGFMITAATVSSGDPGKTMEMLNAAGDVKAEKEVVTLQNPDERALTRDQNNQKTRMGYVFAFLTLGFMFCGIFVAHTVIQEQKEQVLTRIKLTNAGSFTYFLAKFLTGVIVSVILTFVLGIGIMFIEEEKLGMARGQILLLTFFLGLIFCSISLLLGILFEDVMTANVVAFTIWSLSSLLSGLYFPLNATTKLIKVISGIMPQKWFVEGVEMIFVGDNSAYIMLLCIVAAYLTLVVSLGGLGLKMKKAEA